MDTDKTAKTETPRGAERGGAKRHNSAETGETIQPADELKTRVEAALARIRPYLQGDGGDVQLVELDETAKTVKVRLLGGCAGCPSASITLKNGVEAAIKKSAPEIKSVEAV